MAKRQETLDIETALEQMCREKRIYGCKEVTIGFPHQKMGNEICDFLTDLHTNRWQVSGQKDIT